MCLKALVKLTRIEHAFLLALAVIVGQVIALRQLPDATVLALGSLCPFFIEIGSFVFNDYLDVDADRRNRRRDRPLVTGEIRPNAALALAAVSFPLGIALAGFLNAVCLAIAAFFAIAAILYDFVLKKWPFIGNTFIAFTMAIPFVFGNLSVRQDIFLPVSLLASMAFLMGLGREIIGSTRDMKGDRKQGRVTIPIVIGAQNACYLASFFLLFAIFISPIPFFYVAEYAGHLGYLLPVALVDVMLFACVWWAVNLREFWRIRNITLLAQLLGLAGFLLGLFV
jgi:geranylgeranylglycerol-phosphate geranylgeranyltransferase